MISITYKDKCLSDYLQDHHNREGEALIGIYCHNQKEEEAADQILDEIQNYMIETIPEWVSNSNSLNREALDAVKGVDFRVTDDSGNEVDSPSDKLLEECEVQCWFVLSWEKE